jgi:hypothetical protein
MSMVMTTVNVHQAKTHLSRLIEQVGAGEEVVIAKAGRPVRESRRLLRKSRVRPVSRRAG